MKFTIVYWGYMGLYRGNGKEMETTYSILGFYGVI